MELRKPSLVILQFGTNESEDTYFVADAYEKSLRAVLDKLKASAPDSSILVMAPLDRAERTESGGLRTKKVIPKIVECQRRVAREANVAFWNTFKAMGGDGAMAKWVRSNPQLGAGDLTHPTPAGAEVIGDLLFKAFVSGLKAYESNAH
jgi:lysophospholipase L1-like esterase